MCGSQRLFIFLNFYLHYLWVMASHWILSSSILLDWLASKSHGTSGSVSGVRPYMGAGGEIQVKSHLTKPFTGWTFFPDTFTTNLITDASWLSGWPAMKTLFSEDKRTNTVLSVSSKTCWKGDLEWLEYMCGGGESLNFPQRACVPFKSNALIPRWRREGTAEGSKECLDPWF